MTIATLAADVLSVVGTIAIMYHLGESVAKRIADAYFKTVYDDIMVFAAFILIFSSHFFEAPSLEAYAQLSAEPLWSALMIAAVLALYAAGVILFGVLRVALYRAGVRTKQNRMDDQSITLDDVDRGNA